MTRKRRLRIDLITLAAFVPAALAIFLGLLHAAGKDPLSFASYYKVQAVLPTAVSLAPSADVRVAGVKVGHVERVARRGSDALVLLDIERSHAPIFRDATVDVRMRSLVGENYVQLTPGTPSAGTLTDGGILGPARAVEATQVDQVLSAFDPQTRRRLQTQLQELGQAFGGQGNSLNHTLEAASSLTDSSSPVLSMLATQRAQVAALTDDLGRVTRALGDRAGDIRLLANRSSAALSSFAREDADVKSLLRELPGTLTQARATTARLATYSGSSTPVLHDLRVALGGLTPVVDNLAPAAASARRAVSALKRFEPEAPRLLTALKDFSSSGASVIPVLAQLLSHYNPLSGYVGAYTRELGAAIGNLRSTTDYTDALGHVARLGLSATISTVWAQLSPPQRAILERLRHMGVVTDLLGPRGFNPYPAPGSLEHLTPFRGSYTHLTPELIPSVTRGAASHADNNSAGN